MKLCIEMKLKIYMVKICLPQILEDDGKISGPGHSTRRRRLQTLNAAKMLHLGTAENMTPAYTGLMAVLNGSADRRPTGFA